MPLQQLPRLPFTVTDLWQIPWTNSTDSDSNFNSDSNCDSNTDSKSKEFIVAVLLYVHWLGFFGAAAKIYCAAAPCCVSAQSQTLAAEKGKDKGKDEDEDIQPSGLHVLPGPARHVASSLARLQPGDPSEKDPSHKDPSGRNPSHKDPSHKVPSHKYHSDKDLSDKDPLHKYHSDKDLSDKDSSVQVPIKQEFTAD
ncbi:hypothetical protein AWZ03_013874 [Drosophila navojoa]|uniref:Uncharacterized protein n=1 Tax=Drosophila navojoa TaxID=7232 RepID=A0A484AVW0_DRONA|nr:hypothetical protein AWZ03_013874 [Drosophila navojoa]